MQIFTAESYETNEAFLDCYKKMNVTCYTNVWSWVIYKHLVTDEQMINKNIKFKLLVNDDLIICRYYYTLIKSTVLKKGHLFQYQV